VKKVKKREDLVVVLELGQVGHHFCEKGRRIAMAFFSQRRLNRLLAGGHERSVDDLGKTKLSADIFFRKLFF
jgi:hypothetical protein